MGEVNRLVFGDEPKREPVLVYDAEQWAITEREFGALKVSLDIHRAEGMRDINAAPNSQIRMQYLVSNLQLLAEESLYERCLAAHGGKVKTVPHTELSQTELQVVSAKTQHRMGTFAAKEGLLVSSDFLKCVPSKVLLHVGDEFIAAADKTMQAAGVTIIEHEVKDENDAVGEVE